MGYARTRLKALHRPCVGGGTIGWATRGRDDLRLSTDPVSVEARLDGLRVDAT